MTADPATPAPPETEVVLRDMTRDDIRAVRRIESAAYSDAWPARAFESELVNQFARYRVAIERPAGAAVPAPHDMHAGFRASLRRRVLGVRPHASLHPPSCEARASGDARSGSFRRGRSRGRQSGSSPGYVPGQAPGWVAASAVRTSAPAAPPLWGRSKT